MTDLYAQEWSPFTHHFKPTFKLVKREKKAGKTKRSYEPTPKTPYQRRRDSPDIPEATKVRLRVVHAGLAPFELQKNMEIKLQKFFTALGNLNREATRPHRLTPSPDYLPALWICPTAVQLRSPSARRPRP